MSAFSVIDSTEALLDNIHTPADLRRLTDAQLSQLADELRQDTINCVSRTGGHLGSSLGVVELTVAVHAVFDTPQDKLIFDVGHQCYPHKILTERRGRMHTLRQEGGLSGFTQRAESPYDPFGAAHSSTAMSAGLGFAVARDLGGDPGDVVCIVGDGAMSAGMAYEAMNNAGALGNRLFVILNDNAMSIAPPVGGLSNYLPKLCPPRVASDAPEDTAALRSGETAEQVGGPLERLNGGATLFDNLGLSYCGPVDGHDLPQLLAVLRDLRQNADGPVLIHALTTKGKGYAPAEASTDKCHGVARFDVVTGKQSKAPAKAPSYTKVFARALIDEAERDDKIVAITAAMPSGTGVDAFARRFPDRSFDVGIAEQHAVTFAAGLAAGGMKPFCAIYSTFLQRGYDQIVHDVALQGLPVRFAIDRAGLVGADGATHAGAFDVGYLANLPGMVVMAAADEVELVHMVATAAAHDTSPIAFRYPRGEGTGAALPERGQPLEIGKSRIVKRGRRIALLSFGTRLGECLKAAVKLDGLGLSTTVADARFAKPLDETLIAELARDHHALITVEEGATGGFGALVLHFAAEAGLLDFGLRIRTMTLPDAFVEQASPSAMYDNANLNAEHIAGKVLEILAKTNASDNAAKPIGRFS